LAPRLFTVDEYHRMAAAGLFADERVELLDGVIATMSPIGDRHWLRHAAITRYIISALDGVALVIPQGSFPLGKRNEPEPDIALLAPYVSESRKADLPHDLYAMIELSETSLGIDLGLKMRLYARFAIPDYLVVDLDGNTLLHHTQPDDFGYRRIERLGPGETFTLARVPTILLRVGPFLAP